VSIFENDPFGFNQLFRPRRYSFPSPKPNAYTLLQLIEQRELAKKQAEGGTFLDAVKSGGKDALTGLLSLISRPGWAVAEGTRRSLEGEGFDLGDFFKGASRGIQGKRQTGFGEVLDQEGWNPQSGWGKFARGAVGFGLDVATDPLNLLLVAAAAPTGGASLVGLAGKEALEQGGKAALLKAAQKATKDTFSSPHERDAALNLLREAGDPMQPIAALLQTKKELEAVEGLAKGPFAPGVRENALDNEFQRLGSMQAVAEKTLDELMGPKYLQARVKVPFLRKSGEFEDLESRWGRFNRGAWNITPAAGIKSPSLKRVADGASKLNKIPLAGGLLASGTEALGKAFVPGFDNPKVHAAKMAAVRHAEFLHRRYRRFNDEKFKDFQKGQRFAMSADEQLDALEWGEGNEALVDADRKLSLSTLHNAVKRGELSSKQARFIKAWHESTEHLRMQDKRFNIDYEHPERVKGLYVPHLYTRQGGELDEFANRKVANVLSQKGFQYARKGSTTIKGLRELAESGDLGKMVETDPIALLATRTRRGAQAHADRVYAETIAKSFGKPSRVADEERLAKLREKRTELESGKNVVDKRGRQRRVEGATDLPLVDDVQYGRALAAEETRIVGERNTALAARRQKTEDRIATLEKSRKSLERSRRTRDALVAKRWPSSLAQLQRLSEKELKAKINDPVALRAAKKARSLVQKSSVHKSRLAQLNATVQRVNRMKPTGNAARVHGSLYRAELISAIRKYHPEYKLVQGKGFLAPLSHRESWKQRLDNFLQSEKETTQAEIKKLRQQAEETWENARKAQKGLPRKKAHQERSIAAIDRQIARERERLEQDLAKIEERYAAKIEKAQGKVSAERVRQEERSEWISKQLDKNAKQTERALTALKNPDVPDGWLELDKLKMPNPAAGGKMTTISVTPEVKAVMLRQRRVVTDEKALQQFNNAWHKMISRWKLTATVINPGYAARNTLSDAWNMYLSGVPAWAMVKYGAKAPKIHTIAERALSKPSKALTKQEEDVLRLYAEAYTHGILSGLYEGDIKEITRFLKSGRGNALALAKDGHLLAALTRAASEANRHRENWGRLAHYMYRREHEKLSPARAAAEVKAAHFDYEDLTEKEQWIKRNIIPFYTWTRKNIPFQVKQLASRPGRFAAFPKAMNEAEYAATEGETEGGVVPDYLKDSMAFRVPFGDNMYFMPQIGAADLKLLQDPTKIAGMMNPALKIPTELLMNKSLSTGAPIGGGNHPRNPISTDLGGLLRLIPGSNFGQTERTVDGRQVAGLGANPYLTYAFGQVPMTNFAFNQMSNIRREQRGNNLGALAYMTGLSFSDVDPDQTALIELLKFKDHMNRVIRGMRDENFLDESTDEDSRYEQRLLEQIKVKMGRPGG